MWQGSQKGNAPMTNVPEPPDSGRTPEAKDAAAEQHFQSKVSSAFVDKLASRQADKEIRELEERKRPKPIIRNGTWLSAQQFSPVTWTVPGLLPEGVGLLAGKPKAGKSWLSLSMGLSLAAGTGPLGLASQPPRPMLYLALEDGDRRMKQRCGLLGWAQIPELFEYVTEAHPQALLDTVWEWLDRWPGQRPGVVIDTWGKVCPPARKGETTYDRDYRIGGYLKSIAAKADGSTVLVVHHTRKQSAEDFIDQVSGTEGIAGSADTVMVLGRARGEDVATLQVTGRDVDEGSYRLCGFPMWELDGGTLDAAASANRAAADREHLGDRGRQILNRIDRQGQVTTAEVAEMLDVNSDQASAYLSRMASSGKIVRSGRGVYVSTVGSDVSVGSSQHPNTPNGGYTRASWSELMGKAEL